MNPFLDYALGYAARGWSVIPLAPKNKTCILAQWKPYQTAIAPKEVIETWWKVTPDANLGIITGKISNIFVLDIDGQDGLDSIAGKPMPATLTSRTGKGFHYIFKMPAGKDIRNSARKIAPGLDIRAEGGYIVAPPSIHSSGAKYEWVIEEYPADPPQWLMDAIFEETKSEHQSKSPDWVVKALRGVPAGQRDQIFTMLTGHWTRLGVPIEEQIELLKMQNSRNQPPETEKNFEDLVKRIQSNHAKTTENKTVPKEWSIPVSRLLTQPAEPVRWLVEDLWTDESCGFIGGEPKTGKTWVGFDMAVSIAAGEKVFGHFPVISPGTVLYVAEEGSEEQLRTRLHKITNAKSVQADALENFHISIQKNVMVDVKEWQNEINDFCLKYSPRAVFFDPLVRVHSAKENQAEDMRKVLQFFRSLQVTFQCSVIIIHHQRKPNKDDESRTGQQLRGTSDLYAWLDSAIFLKKKKGEDTIIGVEVLHRNAGELSPFSIDQQIDEDEANIFYKEGEIEDIKTIELAHQFEQIILQMFEPEILNKDLVKKIEGNEQLKYKALGRLQSFKTVDKIPKQKRPDIHGKYKSQTVWRKR